MRRPLRLINITSDSLLTNRHLKNNDLRQLWVWPLRANKLEQL